MNRDRLRLRETASFITTASDAQKAVEKLVASGALSTLGVGFLEDLSLSIGEQKNYDTEQVEKNLTKAILDLQATGELLKRYKPRQAVLFLDKKIDKPSGYGMNL